MKRIFNVLEFQTYGHLSYLNYHKSTLKVNEFVSRFVSTKPSSKNNFILPALNDILKTEEEHSKINQQYEFLKNEIEKQGNVVNELKTSGASKKEIENEVKVLKAHKMELEDLTSKSRAECNFERAKMNKHIKKKFFFGVAFSAYGGISGQYDYGPVGCQIVENILAEWHKHFVIRDRMMKVNCSIITPERVLKASGHVDRFTDCVVKDKSGNIFRLDHLIKKRIEDLFVTAKMTSEERIKMFNHLALVDAMNMEELKALMKEYEIKSPETNEDLEEPYETNLMFPLTFGSTDSRKGYLKPEHAQGIILNFKKLLELSEDRLPFACAQVGTAFRNELGTKNALLRVREFTLAEIEHFCHPDDKSHSKFSRVSETKLWLYSALSQSNGERPRLLSIGEAVNTGLIANETMGYYLARTQDFLLKIGIHPRKLRFRQHLQNEMAHYAQDCWDAECLTSYGWVECVGCADRSAYDLRQHTKATGVNMCVERPRQEPIEEEVFVLSLDKKKIRNSFGEDGDYVIRMLNERSSEDNEGMDKILQQEGEIEIGGQRITRDMVPRIEKVKQMVKVERIVPSVIEPSFGIGRIFYTLLEHTFRVREKDKMRTYFDIPPVVAPVKVAVLPLFRNEAVKDLVHQLADSLTEEDVSVWIDESNKSMGRRYVNMDELSIPFCVTVDQDTLKCTPPSVSLRDRNSTHQVRVPISEVPDIVKKLSRGTLTWTEAVEKWPLFTSQVSSKR